MTEESPPGFHELGLADAVLAAVKDVGYETPSPIQLASIGPLLAGRDLLGQAQTGTGKTAAFALPILSRMDLSLAQPQVLVLAPTRELAIQVAEAMQTYARHLKGFHVLPVYGGQGMDFQLRHLRRGVHAVVGTPGRIQDHLRRGTLRLDHLKTVVIDEADEMLRMGFIDDVEDILKHMPEQKQVALFSATMPAPIRKIARRHLSDPVEISIKAKTATVASVTQRYWQVGGLSSKLDALTRILDAEDFDAMLIFVRTRIATTELSERLEARGFASAALSGEMTQALRERVIQRLKNGQLEIVVATDVAARGLDVERISHVVNFDIPYDVEAYIHRIGRTGRAGRKGHAILFVTPRERRMLTSIERATRQPIEPMQMPTREDVVERRVAQFKQSLTETMETENLGFFRELVMSYAAEHGRTPEQVAAALACMVQKERPLRPVPAPGAAAPAEGRPRKPSPPAERSAGAGGRPRAGAAGRLTLAAASEGAPPPAGRPQRPERSAQRPESSAPPQGAVRYRIEVGRSHGVQPNNIVGAIANEAGIGAEHIGRIEIHDAHSTVELPEGMPREIFRQLKKVWVCGQKLAIRVESDGGEGPARERRVDGGAPAPERRKRSKPAGSTAPKGSNKAPFSKPKSRSAPPGFKSKKSRSRTKS